MAYETMYPPQVNSPVAVLTAQFVYTESTMYVDDPADLPSETNVVTVGEGNTAGTFTFTGKTGTTLTGVAYLEGYQGTWASGEVVARRLTAHDITKLQHNVDFVKDHGNLTGLSDDDHPQYIRHALTSQAANDFLVAKSTVEFDRKSLDDVKYLLFNGAKRSVFFAPNQGLYLPTVAPATSTGTDLAESFRANLFSFASDAVNHVNLMWFPPDTWNGGAITVKILWAASSGTGDVVWQVRGAGFTDNLSLSPSFATTVTITDTLQNTNRAHLTAESGSISLNNAATGGVVYLDIFRDPNHASDSFSGSPLLLAVRIEFTTINLSD